MVVDGGFGEMLDNVGVFLAVLAHSWPPKMEAKLLLAGTIQNLWIAIVIVKILKLMTRVSQVSVSPTFPHPSPSMTFEEKEAELLRIYGEA